MARDDTGRGAELLLKLADALEQHGDEIAELESQIKHVMAKLD
jgi:acyl-CoA reductase-like NAD-dependent aldehyde dehydrogenase